jgi:acetyl-CoA acyltransferase
MTREVVIVSALRTPIGKARRGSLVTVRPDDMTALVIKELLKRTPELDPAEVEDVVIGCAFPEGEQGMNMGRMIALRSDLPVSVPGQTVNRFCSSGVQSIALAAYAVMSGDIDVAIAGGVESMSQVPTLTGGYKYSPNPYFAQELPGHYTSMAITAENVAEKYNVSREDQDAFALASNMKAAKAVDSGLFDPELVPVEVEINELDENDKQVTRKFTFKRDEGPRGDSTLEGLAKLRPAVKVGGTVTAGNASQLSDGAAAAIVMSAEKAEKLGLKPLARFVSYAVGGVDPAIMGVGPVAAIPKVLKKAGMKLEDIELIELNEAFAAQSLAVIRELDLNQEITNVNGGAIALGHPLGCTGAKLTTQLLYEMGRRKNKYGMVSMCIGGGMGAAAVFENLQ